MRLVAVTSTSTRINRRAAMIDVKMAPPLLLPAKPGTLGDDL